MSIRDLVVSLPFVVEKRLNSREGFFTAGRMFALLSSDQLLLRLPNKTEHRQLELESGGPLVGHEIPSAWLWVKVGLPCDDVDELRRVVLASHDAVRRASRRRPLARTRRRRQPSST